MLYVVLQRLAYCTNTSFNIYIYIYASASDKYGTELLTHFGENTIQSIQLNCRTRERALLRNARHQPRQKKYYATQKKTYRELYCRGYAINDSNRLVSLLNLSCAMTFSAGLFHFYCSFCRAAAGATLDFRASWRNRRPHSSPRRQKWDTASPAG